MDNNSTKKGTSGSIRGSYLSNFAVMTYSIVDQRQYHHWADGLAMVIAKDGVTMELNSDEIQQIVKALPRTIGGQY